MSFLSGLFGMSNPADSAMPYLQQLAPTISPYFSPYMEAGNQALPQLQQQASSLTSGLPNLQNNYNQLSQNLSGLQNQYSGLSSIGSPLANQYLSAALNPSQLMNQIGSNYQQSPGYDWQLKQAMNASNNAAAAGGMAGTPQHQFQSSQMASNLANQDYYNYMNNALGIYGSGMSGLQNLFGAGLSGQQNLFGEGLSGQQGLYNSGLSALSGLSGQGYGASNAMAQALASQLGNQANLAYSGQSAQNSSMGGLFSGIGNLFGSGGVFGQGGYFGRSLPASNFFL